MAAQCRATTGGCPYENGMFTLTCKHYGRINHRQLNGYEKKPAGLDGLFAVNCHILLLGKVAAGNGSCGGPCFKKILLINFAAIEGHNAGHVAFDNNHINIV